MAGFHGPGEGWIVRIGVGCRREENYRKERENGTKGVHGKRKHIIMASGTRCSAVLEIRGNRLLRPL